MAMVDTVPMQLEADLARFERQLIADARRPGSEDGQRISPTELRNIRVVQEFRSRLLRYATAVGLVLTITRTGLDSPSTRRQLHDLFPDDDPDADELTLTDANAPTRRRIR